MSRPASLLRAFRHPLVIASILALLLNDHLLKDSIPSWLTGKLSDFAGLFFFPFLVGVLIQAGINIGSFLFFPPPLQKRMVFSFLERGRDGSREGGDDLPGAKVILLSSMFLCALIFTAIKTLPAANAFAAQALSRLLSAPVRIALDPTDLIALVMFLPAWKLWQGIAAQPPSAAPGKLAYAALSLGALASLATAPCPTVVSIQRLAAAGNTLYAGPLPIYGQLPQGAYASHDQAKTWGLEKEIPAEIEQAINTPTRLPLALCEPANPRTCFRIDGRPQVEQSLDGGNTWNAAWRIPPGRESYIRRAASNRFFMGCGGKSVDLRAFDMAFMPDTQPPVLVVAMGNEGLLVHSAGQGWQRAEFAVYSDGSKQPYTPAPTPFAARSVGEAFQMLLPEGLIALIAGFLAYLVLSTWAWLYAASHPWAGAKYDAGWVLGPARLLFGWLLILVVTWLFNQFQLVPSQALEPLSWIWVIAALLFVPVSLIISVIIWRRGGALSPRPANFSRLGWLALLLGAGIYGLTLSCFVLWALGIIPAHEFAIYLSTALDLAALAGGILWILYGLRRAFAENKVVTGRQRIGNE